MNPARCMKMHVVNLAERASGRSASASTVRITSWALQEEHQGVARNQDHQELQTSGPSTGLRSVRSLDWTKAGVYLGRGVEALSGAGVRSSSWTSVFRDLGAQP